MLFNNSESIILSFFSDLGESNLSESAAHLDWENGVAGLLATPVQVANKKDAPAFIPAKFKPENEWVVSAKGYTRIDDNVDYVTMMVLDLDNLASLEKARLLLSQNEYFLVPTWSRLADGKDKFRMFIKLDEAIAGEEWKGFVNKIIEATGADEMCSNPSRLYFLPSIPEDPVMKYEVAHNKGVALSRDHVENIASQHKKELRANGDKDELERFMRKTNEKVLKEGVKHFTGQVVSNKKKSSPIIDCSYQGYVSRNMQFIEREMRQGENHAFVSKVTMREIGLNQEKTDLASLIDFIYRAYEEFPNKNSGLFGRGGNTISEIPRLIEGAANIAIDGKTANKELLRQFSPASIDRMMSEAGRRVIEHRRLKAESRDVEAAWHFPGMIDRREKPKNTTRQEINAQLKERYAEQVKKYMDDERWMDFAASVINGENGTTDFKALYNATQFVTFATDMLFQKYFNREIKATDFKRAICRVASTLSEGDVSIEKKIKVGLYEGMLSMGSVSRERESAPAPS